MKKILILISTYFITLLRAQLSPTENYIYKKTYLDYTGTVASKTAETVQYFDGLGRPKQIVNVKASPLGNDVVIHIEYDQFGRRIKDYLPVPQSNTLNGGIVSNPLSNAVQPQIYSSEKIFSEKVLENSTLARIKQQTQIGNDWINKPVKLEYNVNITGEVTKYTTNTIWENNATKSNISNIGFYGAAQLYKNIVIDEDTNKTIEFKNAEGQIILIRKVLNDTENADTYYVYNKYNQLTFVIPPLASVSTINENILNNLCYQYRYDSRNRLVEKKMPGKGWEYMVYDKQDRLILTQDPMLGTTNNNFGKKGWMFTKYDKFGRIVYSGFFANTASRSSMQLAINNMTANAGNNEVRSSTPLTLNGIDIYYTKNAFPTGSMTVLKVNYYDMYPIGSPAIPAMILGQSVLTDNAQNSATSTTNLLVASYIKNIEDDNWTKKFNWYDKKARGIGSYSINHLGGYTQLESELDFVGTVKQSVTKHKRLSTDVEKIIVENFTYDHQNRLLSHRHKVDNYLEEPLVINTYNELGQLSNKKIGRDDDDLPVQSINYSYNIRGWLTQINDPSNLGNSLFGMKIKYQNPEDPNYGISKYNGNISEIDWKTAFGNSNDGYRRYTYQYDKLNRLVNGYYLTPYAASNTQNHFYDEKLTYDINGNIKTLNRFKNPPIGNTPFHIDNLTYIYDTNSQSNKLIQVNDSTSNSYGYPGGSAAITYDLNGNMTNQIDKGISSIKYNYLNLPKQIISSQGNTSYIYRSDGAKVRKVVGTTTIDYLDTFQYENNVLKFIPTSEGFYNNERNEYVYNYTDHLGNIRLSYNSADGGGIMLLEENNYYPFGLKHVGYNDGSMLSDYGTNYNYKYNGKELQETGMYDYGTRFYMPDIGRWGVIDPRSAYTHEAYSYVWNNPILFNDPTGMEAELGKCPPSCPKGVTEIKILPNNERLVSIQEVVLTGKTIQLVAQPASQPSSNSGPASLAMMALYVSQADSPAPGPADIAAAAMLLGAGVWWTYNQFAPPTTGYTTIADPGVGYGSLNTEDDAKEDKDTNGADVPKEKKVPVSGKSGKEAAKDVPSWVKEKGEAPYVDEDGKTFAKRVLDEHHGKGQWNKSKKDTGPTSDYNQIKKWGDRGFEKPKPKK